MIQSAGHHTGTRRSLLCDQTLRKEKPMMEQHSYLASLAALQKATVCPSCGMRRILEYTDEDEGDENCQGWIDPLGISVCLSDLAFVNCPLVVPDAPFRLAPLRSALLRLAPFRLASLRSVSLKSALRRLAWLRLAPFRSALLRSRPIGCPLKLADPEVRSC